MSNDNDNKNRAPRISVEERVRRYVRDYDVRTLAGMLVELEDAYAPYAERETRVAVRKIRKLPRYDLLVVDTSGNDNEKRYLIVDRHERDKTVDSYLDKSDAKKALERWRSGEV